MPFRDQTKYRSSVFNQDKEEYRDGPVRERSRRAHIGNGNSLSCVSVQAR